MTLEDVHLARREWKDSCSSVVCYIIATLSLLLVGLALLLQSWTEWSAGHWVPALAIGCLGVCLLFLFSLASFLARRVYHSHQVISEKYDKAR